MGLPPFWKCGLPWKRMGDGRPDALGPKGRELGGNSGWMGQAPASRPGPGEGPFQFSEILTSAGNFLPELIISPTPFTLETILYFTSNWGI